MSKKLFGAALLVATFMTSGMTLLAHGGFDHVTGTVTAVSGGVLTVKTTTRTVDVKLDGKTEFTRAGQKAEAGDLKPGLRVTVDIPEGSKDNVAHAVKIGATAPHSDAHEHEGHK
jgi:Domain of unknown function (DUF5666)